MCCWPDGLLHVQAPPSSGAADAANAHAITFDDGLQIGATWSPDGRFIAYSSDRGGKFDIWVQQVSGGDPVQITKGPGHNWQPDWSPDGKYIAYRSEEGEGGLYIVPALGGEGLERKIASFGYYPRWSPDSSQIMFRAYSTWMVSDGTFVMNVDEERTHEDIGRIWSRVGTSTLISAAWHPDGKRISFWGWEQGVRPQLSGQCRQQADIAIRSEITPEIVKQFGEVSVNGGDFEPRMDLDFSWAPSGEAIYFERTFRGARNIWKMTVDPKTLKATAVERLTTGPGYDTRFAVSPDGRKLAFTGETRHTRAWLFPFDATRGQVTGPGQAVTSPGMEAWAEICRKTARSWPFPVFERGKWDLWEKSLSDGREAPIIADD